MVKLRLPNSHVSTDHLRAYIEAMGNVQSNRTDSTQMIMRPLVPLYHAL